MVVAEEWGTCPSDKFLVKMAYEETGRLRMVMPHYELFLDVKVFAVPAWMPPLSIEDNSFIHDSLRYSVDKPIAASERGELGELMHSVIATCWQRRLPLRGVDIWPLLNAHGVSPHLEANVIDYFDFGTTLLTTAQRRTAVKRRRMPAMSKGRYLTAAQRELRVSLFGHD